jgi:hypothetical protein
LGEVKQPAIINKNNNAARFLDSFMQRENFIFFSLTISRRRVLQPVLFHERSVSWTEVAVQHILMPIMTPQSLPAKAAPAPLGRLLLPTGTGSL